MIWPWLERIDALKIVKGVKLEKSEAPKLYEYIERMKQLPAVKAIFIKPETHAQFFKTNLAGAPDYELLNKAA